MTDDVTVWLVRADDRAGTRLPIEMWEEVCEEETRFNITEGLGVGRRASWYRFLP